MPAFANAFMFALECWNIALTIAFVLSRVVKFLLATGLYAGRIDRPVLAEGLALDIDSLPRVFRQNLLSAEAHRHPYLVQLGGCVWRFRCNYFQVVHFSHLSFLDIFPGCT